MTGERASAVEADARQDRRALIASGHAVSLLAFDPSRDVYVFDVLS